MYFTIKSVIGEFCEKTYITTLEWNMNFVCWQNSAIMIEPNQKYVIHVPHSANKHNFNPSDIWWIYNTYAHVYSLSP